MSESASHPYPLNSNDSSKSTHPGGNKEVKWEVVAEAAGITLATIIAGRLQAHNIPVRVWQEGAGQALGLTVGLLGTGYVAVPEEFVEQAQAILAEDVEIDPDEWHDDDYFAQVEEEPDAATDQQQQQEAESKWDVVAETTGLTAATIIAGRLQAHDIPVHVWEEGAGHAGIYLSLTSGILGTGYVAVPKTFVEQAETILAEEVEIDPDEWQEKSYIENFEEEVISNNLDERSS